MLEREKPKPIKATGWPPPDPSLVSYIEADRDKTLQVYRIKPELIREHFGTEQSVLSSGYRYRQVFEVVQNGADAILEETEPAADGGRILVRATETHLYVGNTGAPLNKDGIIALLGANSSRKGRNQIGRFGLGFKSLLALGGTIDLFSQSISMRFDPEACQRTIAKELKLPPEEMPPGLRMAEVISFADEAEQDEHLADLGSWATTVLRAEIRAEGLGEQLLQELKNFPREFVLFLPVEVSLELELGDGTSRTIHREHDGDTVILYEGDNEERWLVAERDVAVTDAMRKDAGALHGRKEIQEIPVIWATPLDSSEDSAGRFWAFFPTDTRSRVSGIINAPWKIDFGRSALVPGEFNTALMKAAAALIVDTIPELCLSDDPGRTLDALPRTLESKDEPAAPLVEEMWTLLAKSTVVPDGTGSLHSVEELSPHPTEDQALAERWLSVVKAEDAPSEIIHPSCMKRPRMSRLRELRSRSKQKLTEHDLCWWLEAACDTTVRAASACLTLVSALSNSTEWWSFREPIRQAKIVLADTGELVTAQDAVIEGVTTKISGIYQVEPKLLADAASRKALVELLAIKSLDYDEWQRRIRRLVGNARSQQGMRETLAWKAAWRLLRAAPPTVFEELSDLFDQIRIQCLDKGWRCRHEVLLPGRILLEHEAGQSASLLVDCEFHKANTSILKLIGVADVPRDSLHQFDHSSAPSEYVDAMRQLYWPHLRDDSPNPHTHLIRIIDDFTAPHGWELVERTTGRIRARISQYFLETVAFATTRPVTFGHRSRPETYPKIDVVNPAAWSLLKHGIVEAHGQSISVEMLAIQLEGLRALDSHPFKRWRRGIEGLVACIPDNDYSTLPPRPKKRADQEERSFWIALSKHCEQDDVSVEDCRAIYEWMAEAGWYPSTVGTAIANVDLKDCYVTQSYTLAEAAREAAVPAIVLSPSAAAMWLKNGAQALETQIRIETASQDERPVPLIEVVPEFVQVLADEAKGSALVRFVAGLALSVAGTCIKKPCILDAGELLLDRQQFDELPWKTQMRSLIDEAVSAKWFSGDATAALDQLLGHSVFRLRASVAEGHDLLDRLLRAVRGNSRQLLDSFDQGTRTAISNVIATDARRLAQLALHVHGPATLSHLSGVLKDNGLEPPARWGTQDARDFVAALGFPPEFSVSPSQKRPSELSASGPMPLGDLHAYQEDIVTALAPIIASRGAKARTKVSLPTGAGKTRVAVEAAIKHVLAARAGDKYVLWVAQTDELCEQAVQSFRQVWSNRGKDWTDLRIVRLWGGNPDPTPSVDDAPTAVVATIQTLTSRLGKDRLAFLKSCALVVIDESHHAITPSYTQLLDWFLPEETVDADENLPPVIGLTATPFRGTNEEETKWLANRFGRTVIPSSTKQPELYDQLRRDGILSAVEAEPLPYDAPFAFTPDELDHFLRFSEFSDSALRRLADDRDRNNLIVNRVKKAVQDGPVLLFANSVEHAQHLSARLCLAGVPAASIYADTDSGVRQYFIRQFLDGRVKVLTNYQVLATGFDAPKTATILISRPVFSPVRYMQMVGRGLRGPKNGGTETCKIITVVDNLVQYGDRLAYHYFMRHYS
ncbi:MULTISPECIES: DEAD/DEAH box helicase [unclassified Bradyrhizobium]|uniref:DEAD/DEAH box helicase n=1 Tax=unclassified Bradyrhizobium TaxID=2631580 RepID=UPI002915D6F9|nr:MULTISPECIES: DEAD/DEAH box helicase [unclassified Bradyrhizobium]